MLPLTRYDTTLFSSPTNYKRIEGFKQKPPYNLVTVASMTHSWGSGDSDCRSWSWGGNGQTLGVFDDVDTALTNGLAAKFQGKIGDSSSFGATLTAEIKQTLGMVTGTVLRLASAARKIIRMDFLGAASDLGLPYRERTVVKVHRRKRSKRGQKKVYRSRMRVFQLPNGREVQKTLANGWLFYSYGVKPLTEDLYNGMDVLQRPLPIEYIRVVISSGDLLKIDNRPHPLQSVLYMWKAKVRMVAGAQVTVTNPNLFLLNKMGLINPVQWANEAIPFSFVMDWFSNLSQVIDHLSNMVGLGVSGAWMSKKYELSETRIVTGHEPGYESSRYDKSKNEYFRSHGLPVPRLRFAYEPFSVARALNAISLLVGFLPRNR